MEALPSDFVNTEPSANWRPGQRIRHRKSVDHTLRHGIRGMLRSVAKREDFDVPDLATLAMLRLEVDAAIATAARNLHDRQGHSWDVIGRELGVTRQAAFQRFGR